MLLLAGCPLEDESPLVSCGVSEHCTLEVAGRLLGGKHLLSNQYKYCIIYNMHNNVEWAKAANLYERLLMAINLS